MNLAAAAGGTAARVAVDRLVNWWSAPGGGTQRPFDMGQMAQALVPSNANQARGGRRGGGGGGGGTTRGGSKIVVRDTEIISGLVKGLTTHEFNPSGGLPRLQKYEEMYGRYRIRYMNIAYKAGVGMAVEGNVGMGVLVGPKRAAVTADKVSALRPYVFTPAWKSATISLGNDIDPAKWMVCGDGTVDGVAFTLYINASAASLGVLQVSYEVEFDQPQPF